jgi:hypothetical protein
VRTDEFQQQQCEQENYWQFLTEAERVTVLNRIAPGWHGDAREAIAQHAPDFDICWPILQAHDETRATNG